MKSRNSLRKKDPTGGSNIAFSVRLTAAVLEIAINALLCLYLSELVSRNGKTSALAWIFNQPPLFAAAFCMIFFTDLFLAAILNRPGIAAFFGNLLFLLPALINYYKFKLRGEWFLLPDLFSADVALDVLPNYTIEITPLIVFAAAALLLVFPVLIGFRPMLSGYRGRLLASAAALCAALCAFVFGFSVPLDSDYLPDQLYNNGGTLRALYETRSRAMKKPPAYEREEVLSLLNGHGQTVSGDTMKPDLIFIMSESLFDLVSAGGIEASQDPMDPIRRLQEQFAGCVTLCHSYGGGTFDAEYEVLTGYRSADTPGNISADQKAVRPSMDSVVSMLHALGYESLAIHPNAGSTYRRNWNYAYLGFDSALFREDLPPFSHIVGNYPADDELMVRVLEAYDKKDPGKPWFCHVVTYQNHGGYAFEPDRRDIRVTNRSGMEQRNAENYLNSVLSHAEALENLLEHLSASSRPAVVLLWGDHAPNMGNFAVDTGTGAASARFYETPVLLWNNYGADLSFGEDAVAMYRLGAVVLRKLGLCADPYLDWLAAEGTPDQLTPLRLLEKDGEFYRDDAEYEKLDATLYLLHYDRLLGDNFSGEAAP